MSHKPTHKTFLGHDDLRIAADCFGDPQHEPVILAHGGGQTRHAWRKTCTMLAQAGYYAVAYDARGHGDSEWAHEGAYSIDASVADLIAVARGLGPRKPIVIGASLGGMCALIAEGEHGNVAKALILVDIATRFEMKGVERILDFMRAHTDGFATLDEAAEAISRYLPHRQKPTSTKGLEKNLRQGRDGRWRWHWDPKLMKVGDYITEARLENAARALTTPVLLVRGESSDVLSMQGARTFLEQVPHAQFADVSGAEHMVVGDDNDAFTQAILAFLKSL